MRSLLFVAVSAISLVAQSVPHLQSAVVPGRLDARVTHCAPGALVGLVLGLLPGHVPLPGGVVLGLVPITVAGLTFADVDGRALFAIEFPPGQGAGLQFLIAAITYDVRLPLQLPGAIAVTDVQTARIPAVGDPVDLVVLFGQSNAEGWAPLAELPLELRGALPGLRIWNDVAAAWQPVEAGQNNQLFPLAPRVGPEFGMAAIAAQLPRPVWLVKFAVTQSSLGPTPGPLSEWGVTAGELYPELMRRITAAADGARGLGLLPGVRLVAMMQGESDAVDPVLAQAYAANLADLIARLRADLAARGLADKGPAWFRLGLVAPQLERVGFVAVGAVRAAQLAVAASMPDCDTVETSVLALQPDHVHFAMAGLLTLGREFLRGYGW